MMGLLKKQEGNKTSLPKGQSPEIANNQKTYIGGSAHQPTSSASSQTA